jgi:hypothetical protein
VREGASDYEPGQLSPIWIREGDVALAPGAVIFRLGPRVTFLDGSLTFLSLAQDLRTRSMDRVGY